MTRYLLQGWDNFRKEAKQLRRSFRFNEYKDIRAQNPPRNFFTKVFLLQSCRACPCVTLPQLATYNGGKSACFMGGSPKVWSSLVAKAAAVRCSFCPRSTSRL